MLRFVAIMASLVISLGLAGCGQPDKNSDQNLQICKALLNQRVQDARNASSTPDHSAIESTLDSNGYGQLADDMRHIDAASSDPQGQKTAQDTYNYDLVKSNLAGC